MEYYIETLVDNKWKLLNIDNINIEGSFLIDIIKDMNKDNYSSLDDVDINILENELISLINIILKDHQYIVNMVNDLLYKYKNDSKYYYKFLVKHFYRMLDEYNIKCSIFTFEQIKNYVFENKNDTNIILLDDLLTKWIDKTNIEDLNNIRCIFID